MKHLLVVLSAALALSASSCCPKAEINVIPAPQNVSVSCGVFNAAGAPVSYSADVDSKAVDRIVAFAGQLSAVTGRKSEVLGNVSGKGFSFLVDTSLDAEEYSIVITRRAVKVSASSSEGFLFALQTIGQLLPVAYYGKEAAPGEKWTLPCATIQDKPHFKYRGVLLDVARHYFSVDEIKKYLDIMAVYKLNRLHWHITEDQGWRIEIKKYPRLTEIGSVREGTIVGHLWKNEDKNAHDGIPYGGFYTQDEVREIVAYASSLGIEIIPEIDLPGHMLAALASYPELGCTGGPYKVWTRWGVSEDVLCVGKESTFAFLEDVLTEVIDLFPSEYIHIGGDECPKKAWEKCPACQRRIKELGIVADEKHTAEQYLQSYVTARIQTFLNSKGRKIIGWDEILEGELAEGATVMSWRGTKGGEEAAGKGFDVIMTPNQYLYFDYYQSDKKDLEPLAIGGLVTVDSVYNYRPYKGIPEDARKHILGVQANVWTEYIATPEHLEYMLLPRLAALSEVQWNNDERKDFEVFKTRLIRHFNIYDALDYTYSKAIIGEYGMPAKEE